MSLKFSNYYKKTLALPTGLYFSIDLMFIFLPVLQLALLQRLQPERQLHQQQVQQQLQPQLWQLLPVSIALVSVTEAIGIRGEFSDLIIINLYIFHPNISIQFKIVNIYFNMFFKILWKSFYFQ